MRVLGGVGVKNPFDEWPLLSEEYGSVIAGLMEWRKKWVSIITDALRKVDAAEDLVDRWEEEVREYPQSKAGGVYAKAAVDLCRKELMEALTVD